MEDSEYYANGGEALAGGIHGNYRELVGLRLPEEYPPHPRIFVTEDMLAELRPQVAVGGERRAMYEPLLSLASWHPSTLAQAPIGNGYHQAIGTFGMLHLLDPSDMTWVRKGVPLLRELAQRHYDDGFRFRAPYGSPVTFEIDASPPVPMFLGSDRVSLQGASVTLETRATGLAAYEPGVLAAVHLSCEGNTWEVRWTCGRDGKPLNVSGRVVTAVPVEWVEPVSLEVGDRVWVDLNEIRFEGKAHRGASGNREQDQSQTISLALGLDWFYDVLSERERTVLTGELVSGIESMFALNQPYYLNYRYRHRFGALMGALAIVGRHPQAEEYVDRASEELAGLIYASSDAAPDGYWFGGIHYCGLLLESFIPYCKMWQTLTGQDLIGGNDFTRNFPQFAVEAACPDLGLPPWGDGHGRFDFNREWSAIGYTAAHTRNSYAQWYAREIERRYGVPLLSAGYQYRNLLWLDLTMDEVPPAGDADHPPLPLMSFFNTDGLGETGGLTVMRSGWGEDDTWVSLRCGNNYVGHAHHDLNAFIVYRRGGLALDSGPYAQREFNEDYQRRSVAHNTITVYDPTEVFVGSAGQRLSNDGGQTYYTRMPHWPGEATEDPFWERGDLTALEDVADGSSTFAYVKGDASRAYSPTKLNLFTRELVFERPDTLVVFDRVVSTSAAFAKRWLLHTSARPLVAGATMEAGSGYERFDARHALVYNDESEMYCDTILPASPAIRLVGGYGHWFHVFDDGSGNPRSYLHDPDSIFATREYWDTLGQDVGQWRIEVEPTVPAAEDLFLHVLRTGPIRAATPPRNRLVETASHVGTQADSGVYLFSRTGERYTGTTTYAIEGSGHDSHRVFSLLPDTEYQVVTSLGAALVRSSTAGTIAFRTAFQGAGWVALGPADGSAEVVLPGSDPEPALARQSPLRVPPPEIVENEPPIVVFDEPMGDVMVDQTCEVCLQVLDPERDILRTDLYYRGELASGVIAAGTHEWAHRFDWDVRQIPDGRYEIVAVVRDHRGGEVEAVAPGCVVVAHGNVPPVLAGVPNQVAVHTIPEIAFDLAPYADDLETPGALTFALVESTVPGARVHVASDGRVRIWPDGRSQGAGRVLAEVSDGEDTTIASVDVALLPSLLPGWEEPGSNGHLPRSLGTAVQGCLVLAQMDWDPYQEVVLAGVDGVVYAWEETGEPVFGFPVDMDWQILGDAVAGDLDGDGWDEIVVVTVGGMVYALDNRGNVLPGWPVLAEEAVQAAPLVADLDGDGPAEVVVAGLGGTIFVWDSHGERIGCWTVDPAGAGLVAGPVAGDIDGDGAKEILAVDFKGTAQCLTAQGASLPGWPVALGDRVRGAPLVADVNNDGALEVVVAVEAGSIFVLGPAGERKAHVTAPGRIFDRVLVQDLDEDGTLEFYAGLDDGRLIGLDTGGGLLPGFPVSLEGARPTSLCVADANADGVRDILVGTVTGGVYAVDSVGAVLRGWPRFAGQEIASAPRLGYLGGDGELDLVVATLGGLVEAWDLPSVEPPPTATPTATDQPTATPTHTPDTVGTDGVPDLVTVLAGGNANIPGGTVAVRVEIRDNELPVRGYDLRVTSATESVEFLVGQGETGEGISFEPGEGAVRVAGSINDVSLATGALFSLTYRILTCPVLPYSFEVEAATTGDLPLRLEVAGQVVAASADLRNEATTGLGAGGAVLATTLSGDAYIPGGTMGVTVSLHDNHAGPLRRYSLCLDGETAGMTLVEAIDRTGGGTVSVVSESAGALCLSGTVDGIDLHNGALFSVVYEVASPPAGAFCLALQDGADRPALEVEGCRTAPLALEHTFDDRGACHSPTPTRTFSPTPTATPTSTATATATQTPENLRTYCAALELPVPVPDADPTGATAALRIEEDGLVGRLEVFVDVSHPFVGDLRLMLKHVESETEVVLVDRPGVPPGSFGCPRADIRAVFDDTAGIPAESACAADGPALAERLRPTQPLATFFGRPLAGEWVLQVQDLEASAAGALEGWCMIVRRDPMPTETPTDTPSSTPSPSPSETPTDSPTPTATETPSWTPTPTDTLPPAPTDTPTDTATPTPSATDSPSASATETQTETATRTPTDSPSSTPTRTSTATATATDTPTASPTVTATDSPSATLTYTPTASPTVTATDSPSATPTPSVTWTPSVPAEALDLDGSGVIDAADLLALVEARAVGAPLIVDGRPYRLEAEILFRLAVSWRSDVCEVEAAGSTAPRPPAPRPARPPASPPTPLSAR